MSHAFTRPTSLRRYTYLSITAAITTILLKAGAYWLTGSVGLLSDALESAVNLAAALMALWMLITAERPSTPCAHARQGHAASSRSMCWYRATGACSTAMTC